MDIVKRYTITEVEQLSGLPASTLRYYESQGILKPAPRDAATNRRFYREEELNAAISVACMNMTGLSLESMREYLANSESEPQRLDEQIELLKIHQRNIEKELAELKLRKKYVASKIEYWKAVKTGDPQLVDDVHQKVYSIMDEMLETKERGNS